MRSEPLDPYNSLMRPFWVQGEGRHPVARAGSARYGMKGMGEGSAVAAPTAIASAVRDALAAIGAELNETPITPRRVLAAIEGAQAAAS